MAGNVRRYQAFVDDFMGPLMPVHKFITIAALITGAAQLLFLFNLFYSRFRGKPAPANPWEGTSLEWSIRHRRRSTILAAKFRLSTMTRTNTAWKAWPTTL